MFLPPDSARGGFSVSRSGRLVCFVWRGDDPWPASRPPFACRSRLRRFRRWVCVAPVVWARRSSAGGVLSWVLLVRGLVSVLFRLRRFGWAGAVMVSPWPSCGRSVPAGVRPSWASRFASWLLGRAFGR